MRGNDSTASSPPPGIESARAAVAKRLLELGYPERGTASGIGSAAAKAKSFVSCAIGRVS